MSEKTIMEGLFDTFEEQFKKVRGGQLTATKGDILLSKLHFLDDSEATAMWHAMLSTYFENPSPLCFRPSINLGGMDEDSTVSDLRKYFKVRMESNPYFKNVRNSKNRRIKDGLCAVGYHGSNVFGEWSNMWIKKKSEKVGEEYLNLNLIVGVLAKALRVVTSDRLYAHYREINDKKEKKTDLLCSFILDEKLKDGIKLVTPKIPSLLTDHVVINYSNKFVNDILLEFAEKKDLIDDDVKIVDLIKHMKKLDRHLEGYSDYILYKQDDIKKEIKRILSPRYDDGKEIKIPPEAITDFLGIIQFLLVFGVIFDRKQFHFYYPTAISKSNSAESHLEIPEIFFMFLNEITKEDLKFLDSSYRDFITHYNLIVTKLRIEIHKTFHTYKETQSDEEKKTEEAADETFSFHKNDLPFIENLYHNKEEDPFHKSLLLNHILTVGIVGKEFVSETRIENKDVEYSFILSNRENIELIQRQFGSTPYINLNFREKVSTNDLKKITERASKWSLNDNRVTIGLEISNDEEDKEIARLKKTGLYKAIGLLKGHYTLINRPSRIIALIPDNKESSTIKLFSILDLSLQKLELLEGQTNGLEVLKMTIKKIENENKDKEIIGMSVSKDGVNVLYHGQSVGTYNGQTLEWERPINFQRILNYTLKKHKQNIPDGVTEVITNVIQRISDSHSYGAIIAIGDIKELIKFSARSFLLDQYTGKNIEYKNPKSSNEITKQKSMEDLFSLAIMDGATLIDATQWQIHGRALLQPMMSDDLTKPFHFSMDVKGLDTNWIGAAKYYSVGTRHLNALGLALCTNSLIFVISSTGTITTFFKNEKNTVRGYSMEELETLIPKENNKK